jgi:hypothetical protein
VFRIDMHVHTCLSPCGELEMHPGAIARAVMEAGLDGIVVCDHNAADNAAAVVRAVGANHRVAIPGMEITTEEEVHVVAMLPDLASAGALHARVAAALPGQNVPDVLGWQVIANEREEVLGFNQSRLAGATTWSIERTVDEIHRAGGLAVAAHVDRERFGLVGQLGFVPPGLPLDAVEVSAATPYRVGCQQYGQPLGLATVTGSDAHHPKDIGHSVTFLRMEEVTTPELLQAFRGEQGRIVLGGGRPMDELALHILDVALNSYEAGATTVEIAVLEEPEIDRLTIEIRDNGRGMDHETQARAVDPFFTTRQTRIVGLGLPLLRQAAEAAGGRLLVRSMPGAGTLVVADVQLSHVDRAPLGDLETTFMVLITSRPDVELILAHRRGSDGYELSSADLAEALGGLPLTSPEGVALAREAIRRCETGLASHASDQPAGGRPGIIFKEPQHD